MMRVAPPLLCAGLLSGCMLGAPFAKPALPRPDHWRTPLAHAGDFDGSDWWQQFGDPQLLDLLDQSLQRNADLHIALDRVAMAQDALRKIRSHRSPSVELNGSPTDPITTQVAAFNSGSRADIDSHLFEVAIDASYELDFWGRIANAGLAAKAEREASIYDAGSIQIALMCSVARAYFELRRLDAQLPLARQRVALADERVHLLQLRLDAGLSGAAPRDDARLAQQDDAQRLQNLVDQRALAQQALALLLGRFAEDFDMAPQSGTVTAPQPPEGLPSTLLERRPDVRAAEQHLAAAQAGIAVSQAENFPRISLTARFGIVTGAVSHLLSPGSTVFGIGPDISMPIFDAGRREADIDDARRRYDVALVEYGKSARAAFADVERALIGYQAAQRELRDIDSTWALQNAETARIAAQIDAGRVSRVEWLDSRSKALDSEMTRELALEARLDALLELFQALGGGWDSKQLPMLADNGHDDDFGAPLQPLQPRHPPDAHDHPEEAIDGPHPH
jgi:NodT family efflux transporter outer membrane factor (OMF) lipoprotein